MNSQSSKSNLIPWFAALLFFILLLVISNHSHKIPVSQDICELKKCKPYEFYMKSIQAKKAQWEELNNKKLNIDEISQIFQDCQQRINKIQSQTHETTNEEELKNIHSNISECRRTIETKLWELKTLSEGNL